jgi:hypothetical protein
MLIPDVYEPEYQKMLWYQQHYSCSFGRHWCSVYWSILLWTGPQGFTNGFTSMRHIKRRHNFHGCGHRFLLYMTFLSSLEWWNEWMDIRSSFMHTSP